MEGLQLMPDLTELRGELLELAKWRAGVVAEAEAAIASANRRFDEEATRLNRQIRKLEPKSQPEPAPTVKPPRKRQPRFSLEGMEDWSPEEIEHYKKLKGVS